jgi:HK97 family phage major capsid protein
MKNQNQIIERAAFLNAMSTTTGSQGGYAVPSLIAAEVADALKTYSAMRQVSTVIGTPTGAAMGWPNSDGTNEVGEMLAQNAPSTVADTNFGTSGLATYRFGSKVIEVPIELMQDSAADPLGFLIKRIGARIGRITNRKFTIGTGANEPLGIIPAATIGKTGGAGQTITVTHDDLADLVSSVDEAYRQSPNCVFMMADSTLQAIRKLKDTAGHPLNLVTMGPDGKERLLGYRVVINPDVPAMAAEAKSIAFGDFSTFIIRDLPAEGIRKMDDSAPALKGQVWFVGFVRSGGAYTDVGGAIKLYQNATA